MSAEVVVGREVCEKEFQRFCDAMDLVFDESKFDDDDKKSFRKQYDTILQAMGTGRLVINDKGEPVYSPTDGGAAITFYEPVGADHMAQDQKKAGQDVAKGMVTLASMTKVPVQTFSKMKQRDLKVCLALMMLFLG